MSDAIKASRRSTDKRQTEYMRGGKGRKDEVGGSGVYPASAANVPEDAVVRGPGEFGHSASHHPHSPPGNPDEDATGRSGDSDR